MHQRLHFASQFCNACNSLHEEDVMRDVEKVALMRASPLLKRSRIHPHRNNLVVMPTQTARMTLEADLTFQAMESSPAIGMEARLLRPRMETPLITPEQLPGEMEREQTRGVREVEQMHSEVRQFAGSGERDNKMANGQGMESIVNGLISLGIVNCKELQTCCSRLSTCLDRLVPAACVYNSVITCTHHILVF